MSPHVSPSLRRAAAFGLAALLASGCGSESTAPASIAVGLTANVQSASPTGAVTLTLTARPKGGARVTELELRPLGIASATPIVYPVASSATPPYIVTSVVSLPAAVGAAKFVAVARGGGLEVTSDTVTVTVADVTAPVIDSVHLSYVGVVPAGQWLTLDVYAHDDAIVQDVVGQFTGTVTQGDSTRVESRVVSGHQVGAIVSGGAPVGAPVQAVVRVRDAGGNIATRTFSLTVVDRTPPLLTAGTLIVCQRSQVEVCVPGDTAGFVLRATEDHELAWLGYRVHGAATGGDSIAVTGQVDSLRAFIPIPRDWIGTDTITYFARDASGNETAYFRWHPTVIDAVRWTGKRISDPGIYDAVYDSTRSLLWASIDPGWSHLSPRVVAYGLDGTVRQTILLPSASGGIDLGTGAMADTLVVTLLGTGRIAKLSIAAGTVDTVRIASDSALRGFTLGRMRLLEGNRLLATLVATGQPDQLLAYDLTSGSELSRATVAPGSRIERSANRAVAVISDGTSVWRYAAATGTLAGPASTDASFGGSVTLTAQGDAAFVAGSEFDAALRRRRQYRIDDSVPWSMALSADESAVYLLNGYYSPFERLDLVRRSDGAVLGHYVGPWDRNTLPESMRLVDGGRYMLGWAIDFLWIAQLPSAAPAP